MIDAFLQHLGKERFLSLIGAYISFPEEEDYTDIPEPKMYILGSENRCTPKDFPKAWWPRKPYLPCMWEQKSPTLAYNTRTSISQEILIPPDTDRITVRVYPDVSVMEPFPDQSIVLLDPSKEYHNVTARLERISSPPLFIPTLIASTTPANVSLKYDFRVYTKLGSLIPAAIDENSIPIVSIDPENGKAFREFALFTLYAFHPYYELTFLLPDTHPEYVKFTLDYYSYTP